MVQGTATQFGGPGKVGAAAISDALDMTIALIRVLGRSKLPPKLQRHALTAGDLSSGQVRPFRPWALRGMRDMVGYSVVVAMCVPRLTLWQQSPVGNQEAPALAACLPAT